MGLGVDQEDLEAMELLVERMRELGVAHLRFADGERSVELTLGADPKAIEDYLKAHTQPKLPEVESGPTEEAEPPELLDGLPVDKHTLYGNW